MSIPQPESRAEAESREGRGNRRHRRAARRVASLVIILIFGLWPRLDAHWQARIIEHKHEQQHNRNSHHHLLPSSYPYMYPPCSGPECHPDQLGTARRHPLRHQEQQIHRRGRQEMDSCRGTRSRCRCIHRPWGGRRHGRLSHHRRLDPALWRCLRPLSIGSCR